MELTSALHSPAGLVRLPPISDPESELASSAEAAPSPESISKHQSPPPRPLQGDARAIRTATWIQPTADVAPTSEETPTSTKNRITVPVGDPSLGDRIRLTKNNDLISLTVRDAPLDAVLALIAEQHGLNIVAGEEVNQRLSVTLTNVRLEEALDAMLAVNGFAWARQQNILTVSRISADKKTTAAAVQGRVVRIFPLNYVTAVDVDKIAKGLLSPVGQSFVHQTLSTDHRRTMESLVVEDLPTYVARIEDYLRQIDHPPRQVLVEAHVLQVTLKDNCRHGVNFKQIAHLSGTALTFETAGLASSTASPAALYHASGTDLEQLIEALRTTTDAKTLASPKVAVLNGQEAKIQIGGTIGYLTTTTTQTSTSQNVNFLDTGVILKVIPIITADNRVLLQVKPQISDGKINPTTSLPESTTTQVETQVMLDDGEAIVIGGLIKESDSDTQNKLPVLGDLRFLGRLFQKREVDRQRAEIIITLQPRIVHDAPCARPFDPSEITRAHSPLVCGPLLRVDRTAWEAELPDARWRIESVPLEACPHPGCGGGPFAPCGPNGNAPAGPYFPAGPTAPLPPETAPQELLPSPAPRPGTEISQPAAWRRPPPATASPPVRPQGILPPDNYRPGPPQ